MPNDHTIRFLEMGSCYNGYRSYGEYTKWLGCAWTPDDCDLTVDGNSFVGTDQDEDYIKLCNPNDQRIGRCMIEDKCALRPSDCGTGSSSTDANFKADDPTCTIQRDKSKEWDIDDPQYTQFGSCLDKVTGDYLCVYNPTDCDESGTEEYVNAADTLALGVTCDCSEVHVSACVTDSKRAFCAIDAEGCRSTWPYYSVHTQRLHRLPDYSGDLPFIPTPGLDCRLCRKKNTPAPTPAPTMRLKPTKNPTKSPTKNPTKSPVTSPTTQSPNVPVLKSEQTEKSKNGPNIGAIVGGSIGGVVFIAVLVLFYVKLSRDEKKREARKKRRKKRKPTTDIFIEM